MAFAGWRPDGSGARDVVLVCDPGDNSLADTGHTWRPQPSALPVHVGRQRPTIVLQPAGAFTVTGAIVVIPRSGEFHAPRMEATSADGMPDLSQDFSARWSGLCGPTSAADLLFSMRAGDDIVLKGFVRGPGDEADMGVIRLIAGERERIVPQSLAGRMGVAAEGLGASNEGIRRGLESWLEERAPDAWTVRLDWFEDAAGDRPRAEQRAFFGRLATAVASGGGAVLCLWPGTEFANAPIDPAAHEGAEPAEDSSPAAASGGAPTPPPPRAADGAEATEAAHTARPRGRGQPALPPASFPELPLPPAEPGGLPGRRERIDPRAAAAEAATKIDSARRHLQRGRAREAYEQATAAVALLHEASLSDPELRTNLAEALELCRTCEAGLPRRRSVDRDKATAFQ